MTQANVDIVRKATEAFIALDFERWASFIDAGCTVYPRAEEPGVEESYEGMEGVGTYLANWYAGWEEYTAEPLEYIDVAEDYVIVDMREAGVAKGSGIRVEENFAHAFRVADGKITEWRMFGPVEEALAAVAPG